jgi:hypothetical protein
MGCKAARNASDWAGLTIGAPVHGYKKNQSQANHRKADFDLNDSLIAACVVTRVEVVA